MATRSVCSGASSQKARRIDSVSTQGRRTLRCNRRAARNGRGALERGLSWRSHWYPGISPMHECPLLSLLGVVTLFRLY